MRFLKISKSKKKDIFKQYFIYNSIAIFAMVFLVPIGAYLLTHKGVFLSWPHIVLAGVVGLAQVWITWVLRKRFEDYWQKAKASIDELANKVSNIQKLRDIEEIRREKDELIKPLLVEQNFYSLGRSISRLLNRVLNIMEVKLFKEELLRKLTYTLDTERISNIFINNLIRHYKIPAAAIYLENPYDGLFTLKDNKGFANIKKILDESFIQKITPLQDILIREDVKLSVDFGICEIPTNSVYVYKLSPRKGEFIGVVFLALGEDEGEKIQQLEEFLKEVRTSLGLIFEKALEHEKSILMANIDPLTGVFNRRGGLKATKELLQEASTKGGNVCFLVLDIDHFKNINDTYGHDVGDKVLKKVIEVIKNLVRKEDIIIRWGGEEFIIVLSNISTKKAVEIAERIRKRVEQTPIKVDKNKTLRITVSVGVACSEKEKTFRFEKLFEIADRRLYEAKNRGRNKVVAT